MAATVEISVPDSLIKALGARADELPRQTFEALIVQAYRKARITHAEVGELLKKILALIRAAHDECQA